MELKKLTDTLLEILKIKSVDEITKHLFETVINNDIQVYEEFCKLINNDLSVDWLQMIFQYYHADRKEKMQDYTPKSLARFISRLAGESDVIIDMCAGSGALTIQKWNMIPEQVFCLYEFDKNVIPYLLFNMAVRNIRCTVYHADVLQDEIYHTYMVFKGDKYGEVKEIEKWEQH